ncbi:hypothetical protein AAFF_G00071550 [Aldrovandia affinis]|uniref:Uncharacterized protein n=1 Tax=Aldrovandia affinis TaxID=143900 RepID=A0AAD7WDB6_9TELE|nr:hypothetical protein AAFF_G00071550 [Aldrovandia affinis]
MANKSRAQEQLALSRLTRLAANHRRAALPPAPVPSKVAQDSVPVLHTAGMALSLMFRWASVEWRSSTDRQQTALRVCFSQQSQSQTKKRKCPFVHAQGNGLLWRCALSSQQVLKSLSVLWCRLSPVQQPVASSTLNQ